MSSNHQQESSSIYSIDSTGERTRPQESVEDSKSEIDAYERIERKDFPNALVHSGSETINKKATPKSLRFRVISPSSSNASASSFDAQPVVFKPSPVIVKNKLHHEHPTLQRKHSVIATVTVNGNEPLSSQEFQPKSLTIGNPTPVEFLDKNGSVSSFGSTTSSTSSTIVKLPIDPTKPGRNVLLPSSGRTHCNSMIGADRPREGPDYFQFAFPPNKKALGVVIPFFNEEERELRRTLESLESQSKVIWKKKNLAMHVLLIMDGWSKASDSMREYVKFMFPAANSTIPWWSSLEDKNQQDVVETFFVQKVVPYGKKRKCVALGEVPIVKKKSGEKGKQRSLYITLIIKRDNRRKHNSHEWFFGRNGFAEFYNHEYLFATDCGTLFEDDCVVSLISYMEHNPSVSVSTGRQRVMSRAQQESKESILSLDTLYRLAQCYDYESSFACFMGAFALFGFLPVIPGPCGLYRAADMLGAPRDWYFDVVNTDPDKSGMVLGNLRIAEDRVLSYAAVLKTEEPRRMALIPEATFYFEAECSLEKFLLQRRRWTNGTVAGYIYMCLQNPGLLFGANMNPIRKIAVYFLLMCQVLVYAVVGVSPAIFLLSLHSTIRSVFPTPNFPQTYPEIVWGMCIALYVGMVISHSKQKYKAWMFYSLMIVSFATIIGAFWTFGYYIYENGLPSISTTHYQWVSIYTVIAVTGLPLAIAFLHSPKSFLLMVISVIPYYLFLPTIVAWFSAYAFARTWDLTWGNRPASAEHANINPTAKVNVEKELKAKAMTLCIFVVMCNLVFILLVEQLQQYSIAILILAGFIFTFAIIQMFLSTIYFMLYYDPRRIIQGCWSIASTPFRKKEVEEQEEESDDEEVDNGYGVDDKSIKSGTSEPDMKPPTRSSSHNIVKPTRSRSDLFVPRSVSRSSSGLLSSTRPNRESTPTMPRVQPVGSKSKRNSLEIVRPSGSKTVIDIKEISHNIENDEAEVIMNENTTTTTNNNSNTRRNTSSSTNLGQVKRTPSIANAV